MTFLFISILGPDRFLTIAKPSSAYKPTWKNFQKKLKNDINEIKTCNKILVSADKSRNLCKLEKDQYEKVTKEKIAKTFKNSTNKTIGKINNTAKQITEKLLKADRVPMLEETYITIKYHKSEFPNKIPCRSINPAKSSFGSSR